MKQNVIEFFQNLPAEKSEQFNKAFELYRKSSNKNSTVERSLNVQGFSERTLENLLYDLQKLHEITDAEKIVVPAVNIKKELPDERIAILAIVSELLPEGYIEWFNSLESKYTIESLIQFAISVGNDKAIEVLDAIKVSVLEVNGLEEENKNLLSEKGDLEWEKEVLEDEKSELENENETLKEKINELTAVTGTSIREEFPFLNDKECPNELKILVADKITAWKSYEENHAQLLKIESGELVISVEEQAKIAEAAKVAFEENQAIYEELNAYKETGKVLGKHPIFKTLQFQREVEEMTPEELNKYIGSSSKYFTDNKKSLVKAEKENDEEMINKIKTRVADREIKLALVNKKLGIPAK